jgi:transposase
MKVRGVPRDLELECPEEGIWVLVYVERTLAWISRNRRLTRDYERYARTVAAFVRLAMIRLML